MIALRNGYIFFLILIIQVFSRQNLPAQNRLTFKHLSQNEGLSQSPIFCIFQDSRDFVWIGNRDGLIRYDGYQFKNFSAGMPNYRDINTIYEDVQGHMWIGSFSGLYLFDRVTEKFKNFRIKGVSFVYKFLPAEKDCLWMATDNGLRKFNYRLQQEVTLSIPVLKGERVLSLLRDKHQRIWSGLANGVRLVNSAGANLPLPDAVRSEKNLSKAKILAIADDQHGRLWFGTEGAGLFCYDPGTEKVTRYKHSLDPNSLCSDFVRDIYAHSNGSIWIGTRGGLSIFNPGKGKFSNYVHHVNDPDGLTHSTVWRIMRDRAGSIWMGTYAGGINIYNPVNGNFEYIGERMNAARGLNHPVVSAVLPAGQDRYWVGTEGGGLNFVDRTAGTVNYYPVNDIAEGPSSNFLKCMLDDGAGTLWLGTLEGLVRFNTSTHQFSYFNFYGNPDKQKVRINAITRDESSTWLGTDAFGLVRVAPGGSYVSYAKSDSPESLSNNRVNTLFTDDSGGVWAGTNNGLNRFDKTSGKFRCYFSNKGEPMLFNAIQSLFEDHRGLIWAGSRSGLYVLNPANHHSRRITRNDGLENEVIQAITEDDSGNIWVSSNNGIARLTLKAPADPLSSALSISVYTSADGLASNQFSTGAVHKDPDGKILFGGVNGITIFNPDRLIATRNHTPVTITDFTLYGKPVDMNTPGSPLSAPIEQTRSITLNHDQGFISFRFSALNFVNPTNIRYAYKLEGLAGSDWTYAGNDRVANFTNLPPGDYTFRVRSEGNEGFKNNRETSVKVLIKLPLWKTWWAWCLYILAGGSLLLVVARFFLKQERLKRDLYYEHLQSQRQEELYQMKLQFFTNISHEIRTPLTLILGPLEKLLQDFPEQDSRTLQLRQIRNNANRLMRLVTELMDFRKAETGNMTIFPRREDVVVFAREVFDAFVSLAGIRGIRYEFQGEGKMYADIDRVQMEKVLFNLLSNAFKFTPEGGTITMGVTMSESRVGISVTDNGKGIPPESIDKLFTNFYQADTSGVQYGGTGIGLALAKSIVELHAGKLEVKSSPPATDEKGLTTFNLSIPAAQESLHLPAESSIRTDEMYMPLVPDERTGPVAEPDGDQSKQNTILLVEDNAEVRHFLSGYLGDTYRIQECEDGKQAWILAPNQIPDLVISDVMMPEMNGTDLCQKLKSDPRTSHIPVILLTARAAHEHHVEGLNTGADAYITKPCSLELLSLTIRNLLSAREAMRQVYSRQVTLEPRQTVLTSPDEKFLDQLIGIVEEHLENPEFDVDQLATTIGMSESVLYRKLKAVAGLTVAEFVKSIRLKKAALLLKLPGASIAEVAFSVGFNNRKHFSREFKKQFGCTPSEFVPAATEEEHLSG